MKIKPLNSDKKLVLTFPKGELPDFKAAGEAFGRLVDEDEELVRDSAYARSGYWDYAETAEELKEVDKEDLEELTQLTKSGDGDGYYYIKMENAETDSYLFWSSHGVGDNLNGSCLYLLLDLLQFRRVAKALGGEITQV